MRFKLVLSLLTATLGSLVAVGCGGGSDPNMIRIVSSLPRTGSAKKQTDSMVNGIKMALDEAGGKIGDFRLDFQDWDDATASAGEATADMEQRNAQRAAGDSNVMVYLGPYNSGVAKISMPILNRAGLLMISPANTATGLTKPGKGGPQEPQCYRPTGKITYTRVVPADDLQGSRSAEFCQNKGIQRVYILDDKTAYGQGIADIFEQRCKELNIKVLGHDNIDSHATEFKSLMTSIKDLNPDLVYFGGTTQTKGGQLAKDLVATGSAAKMMVPDGCFEEAFIEAAGAENLNDRCYVTFGGLPPDKLEGNGKAFVEKYKAKYQVEPEAYAVYGYEAGRVAVEAIRRAGKKDRAAIVEACLAIHDFDGALGKWSFDANGDTTLTTITVNLVKGGKFTFHELLNAPAPEAAAK